MNSSSLSFPTFIITLLSENAAFAVISCILATFKCVTLCWNRTFKRMLIRRLSTWTVKTRWPITSQIDCSAPPTDPHLRLNDVLMLFCLIWTVRLWSTSLSRDPPNPNFPNRGNFSSALWVYIHIIIIIILNITLLVVHTGLTEVFSYVNRCEWLPVSWLFSVMCAENCLSAELCEEN